MLIIISEIYVYCVYPKFDNKVNFIMIHLNIEINDVCFNFEAILVLSLSLFI